MAGSTARFDAVGARLFEEHRRNEIFRSFAAESGMTSLADAYDAQASVGAAVELVDDRNCDYALLDVMSLVADNSWNAGVILGEPVAAAGLDLVDCDGIVTPDGAELDRGHGRDALGGPLIPLEWVANHLLGTGGGLRAGDIVMTGSLIPTQFPKGPCRYRFTIAGIGAVEVAIVA